MVFLRFTHIFQIRGHDICTPSLTLQQIMSNFFALVMEICNKFGPSELNHCGNRKALCTFQYTIEAL